MLTQDKIDTFFEDLANLKLINEVSILADKMGVSKGNVSTYLKTKKPSEAFIDKFYESFKIVPQKDATVSEKETVAIDKDYLDTLTDIKESHKKLVDSHAKLVNTNLKLVDENHIILEVALILAQQSIAEVKDEVGKEAQDRLQILRDARMILKRNSENKKNTQGNNPHNGGDD